MEPAAAAAVSWHWLWLPLALMSSLVAASNIEANRRAKQDGFRLNLWRTTLSSLMWLPLALFHHWPHDGMFYAAAMFSGVSLIIGFTIQNNLAARHNGRVALLYMPLKAVGVFLIWTAIDGQARAHLFERPWVAAGVLLCLGAIVAALAEFRKHDVSWSSLKAVLPVIVVYGAGDILARLNMAPGELVDRLVVFLAVMNMTSAMVSSLIWPWRPKRQLPLFTKPLLLHGLRSGMAGNVNQVCFFISLVVAPNPAYPSMILLLTPVWLLVYHRLAKVPDDASPVAGTLMVVAAIVLMVLVS